MEKGAVYTGIYPNIFELAGYEKKEIENRIDQIFQTLFYGSDEEICEWNT